MTLVTSGATNSDISFMYRDPVLDSLRNYKAKQDARYTELHQTSELIKRDVSHLMLSLDSPAQRFIDECLIPVMTLTSLIPGPQQVVTIPATALACAVRAVPMLGRAATAFGAEYVFNKAVESLNEKAAKSKETQTGRKVSTREDLDGFIQRKIDNGVCEKWRYVDGKQTYKFTKDDGIFKKGDLFTKDTRHFEAEWWTTKGAHKGAIEPINGTQYKPSDFTKSLNVK